MSSAANVLQPSKLCVAALLVVGLSTPVHAADIVAWDILQNGLCEVAFDRDGDGIADMTELHVVEWSGRSASSEVARLDPASLDRVWLFIVEEDNGEFIYAVQIAPLTLSTEGSAPSTSPEEAL